MKQRGDTLVEVMFATAIAALLIIIAISAMNRSLAQIQMSAETTFVRQSMDSEAEVLRFVRDAYMDDRVSTTGTPALWKTITSSQLNTNASSFGECDMTRIQKEFVIDGANSSDTNFSSGVGVRNLILNSTISSSTTFATIGNGIWVEAVSGGTPTTGTYIDFHIRACWDPPFSSSTKATLGTIVRQYYE